MLPLPPPLADGTRQVLVTIPRRKTCPRVAWSCRPGLGGEPLEEPVFEGKPCGTPEGLTLLIPISIEVEKASTSPLDQKASNRAIYILKVVEYGESPLYRMLDTYRLEVG